ICIRSYCICYYLAEFLAVTTCNRRTYVKTIYRFLTVLNKIKKIYFWLSGAPCSAGALGPGLAGLCLKTALVEELWSLRSTLKPNNLHRCFRFRDQATHRTDIAHIDHSISLSIHSIYCL